MVKEYPFLQDKSVGTGYVSATDIFVHVEIIIIISHIDDNENDILWAISCFNKYKIYIKNLHADYSFFTFSRTLGLHSCTKSSGMNGKPFVMTLRLSCTVKGSKKTQTCTLSL